MNGKQKVSPPKRALFSSRAKGEELAHHEGSTCARAWCPVCRMKKGTRGYGRCKHECSPASPLLLCSRKRHRGLWERIGWEKGRRPTRRAQSDGRQPEPALGDHRPGRLHGNRAEHSESTDTDSGETRWKNAIVTYGKNISRCNCSALLPKRKLQLWNRTKQ